MKITHLYHSGFCVELEQSVLLFDWYEGVFPSFDPAKTLYVFVSHRHPDHYSKKIWELRHTYPNIHYILYKGICKLPPCEITAVKANEAYTVGDASIRTLLSTDEGVAYLVTIEGYTLYHAGDLNLWYWEGEAEQDNKWQIGTYKASIRKLKTLLNETAVDIAFLTLDPRQEENAILGMEYFLHQIDVRCVLPMHYWDRQKEAMAYLTTSALAPFRDKIHFDDEVQY